MILRKNLGKLIFGVGLGLLSGMLALHFNVLLLKTCLNYFGCINSYAFTGLIFIALGLLIHKKGDIEISTKTLRK